MNVAYRDWILIVPLSLTLMANVQEDRLAKVRHTQIAQSVNSRRYPSHSDQQAGGFIITADPTGKEAFDPTLGYALQRSLDSIRAVQDIEGASAAVFIPGRGTWQGVSGISSRAPFVGIDPSMLFGVGSNTKAFVSATLLRLAEEGMLSLDDSLSRWLPAYPNITGSVTIRQLMNMTSGLFDYLNDSNAQGDSVESNPTRLWTPEELIRTFVGPPRTTPGGAYRYCNTNYILLGMVIKSVTGKSVSSEIRERILTPLALDHTYLEVEELHHEPVAHPWDSGNDFASVPVAAHFSTLWTAGGMISTAENMVRWIQALFGGTMLSQASLHEMLTLVPMSANAATGLDWNGYGLGVRQGSYYGKRVLGHTGMVMGYVSIVGYLPRTGASFAVLFNASEAGGGRALTALLDAYLRTVKIRPAQPGACYAVSGKSDGSGVYLANSSTAALVPVGSSCYGEMVGARVDPRTGMLWGLSKAVGWELVQIDGETGEAYPRVRVTFPPGSPADLRGLDFSPAGTLHVGSVDGRIYAIDTATGIAVQAAASKISISGLAFDPTNGELWASIRSNPTLRDRIYKIVLPAGDTVGVGNTGFNQPLVDLAFDPSGNLFGLVGNPASPLKNRLARIDRMTGVGTEIDTLGLTGMVSIAFSPAPTGTGAETRTLAGVPANFGLEQNYPNPFNPSTRIEFSIVSTQFTILRVYDILGREVATLVNESLRPGHYTRTFDGMGLASGIYVYRLQVRPLDSAIGRDSKSGAGGFVETRKAILLR